MTPEQKAAHDRMPAGTQYRLLSDEPMTEDERRAEAQRKRIKDWHRRKNAKPAPDLRVLMEWGHP